MTITYDQIKVKGGNPQNPLRALRITIALASETYATGGFAVDWANSGLDGYFPSDDDNIVAVLDQSDNGFSARYDFANSKMKLYYLELSSSTDAEMIEVANGTSITATLTLCVLKS